MADNVHYPNAMRIYMSEYNEDVLNNFMAEQRSWQIMCIING